MKLFNLIPFPYKVLVYEISQSPQEFKSTLERMIRTQRGLILKKVKRRPFVGKILNKKFKATLDTFYGNSWRPILEGEYYSENEKSHLIVTYRLPQHTQLFMFICILFLITVPVLLVARIIAAPEPSSDELKMLIVMPFFALLIYLMAFSFYKGDFMKSYNQIKEVFGEKVIYSSDNKETSQITSRIESRVKELLSVNYKKWIIFAIIIFVYFKFG